MSSSDTEDGPAKAKKKQCVTFEPQAWRKSLCKNCFKTREEHTASSQPTSPRPATPSIINGNNDIVTISRRERTPVNEVILNRDDEDPLARARSRRSASPSVFQTPVYRRTDSMPNVSGDCITGDAVEATARGSSGDVSKSPALVGEKTGKSDTDRVKADKAESATEGKKSSPEDPKTSEEIIDKTTDRDTSNNQIVNTVSNKTAAAATTGKVEPENGGKPPRSPSTSDVSPKVGYPTRGKLHLVKSSGASEIPVAVTAASPVAVVGTVVSVPATEQGTGDAFEVGGQTSTTLTSEIVTSTADSRPTVGVTTSVTNDTQSSTTRPEAARNSVDSVGSAINSSLAVEVLVEGASAADVASAGGEAIDVNAGRASERRRDEEGTVASANNRPVTEIVGARASDDVEHHLAAGTQLLDVGGSSEQLSAANDDVKVADSDGGSPTPRGVESGGVEDVGRVGNASEGTTAVSVTDVPVEVSTEGGTGAGRGDWDVQDVRHAADRGRHELAIESPLPAAGSAVPECTSTYAANDVRTAVTARSPDENNFIADEVSSIGVTSASLGYLRTSSSKSSEDTGVADAPSAGDDNDGRCWASYPTAAPSADSSIDETGCGFVARASSPVDEYVDSGSSQCARAEATIVLTGNSYSARETSGGIYVVSGLDLAQSPGAKSSTSDSDQWLDAARPETGRQTGYICLTTDDFNDVSPRLVATDGGETSLFHHVPGNDEDDRLGSGRGYWDQEAATLSGQLSFESDSGNRSPGAASGSNGAAAAAASRRRRRRIISSDDSSLTLTDPAGLMSASEFARSEAMMEGTRLLMDSLREKVALLEDKCEKLDREKLALSDLLVAKKTDYDRMKDRCNQTITDLEDEVLRLKSEKARLLDRLQLPESERASLAAEENEIAELKRRLEDYEIRYGDAVVDNEDLRQEVRDLQLAMAELQDQFRDDETIELRDLQRELEATAKACRIAQFKLRKAERRCDQLEQDRIQADEKVRSLENCLQGSDDKRRLRLLEDDLRKAKEAAVRLHDDVERAEERRQRHQDDLDRVKNLLNESENRRLILQNQLDNAQSELLKLREQLKFEGRLDLLKPSVERSPTSGTSSVEMATAVAQLTRDLAASEERENDLREQLKFAEQEIKTIRKKLSDAEEEVESMSLQLRKLTSAKRGSPSSSKLGSSLTSAKDVESATQREAELRLQMELAEQEVTVLRRKIDVLQSDNENLMTAVKYLRAKVEGSVTTKSSAREHTSTGDLLASVIGETSVSAQEVVVELVAAKKTIVELSSALERSKTRVDQTAVSIQSTDIQSRVEELERLLAEERQKVESSVKERQAKETELLKVKDDLQNQLTVCKTDLEKTRKDLETARSEGKKSKEGKSTQKQYDELKKQHDTVEAELKGCKDELKAAQTAKENLDALQKNYDELKESHDKLLKEIKEKEKSSSKTSLGVASIGNGSVGKDREPASWRWDKQEMERQIKELKKKNEDLAASQSPTDSKKVKVDAQKDGECSKCSVEKTDLRCKLDQIQQELDKVKKEKESKDKKDDGAKVKTKVSTVSGKNSDVTIADLTSKLEKKEAEAKTAQEKLEELQRQLEKKTPESKKDASKFELKSEIKRLEQELELAKVKAADEEAQKSKMAAELKAANEKNDKTGGMVGGLKKNDDSKAVTAERDTLAKEKQKLTDELNKLKKETADADKQRKTEKVELEKNCMESKKLVEKLQAEINELRSQLTVASTPTSTKSTSSGVAIPVQHEKSTSRTIPIQKVNGTSKSSPVGAADSDADSSKRVEELEKTFRAERAGLEESHRVKVKALEDQATRARDQLAMAKKESEKIALESKTTLAEVRSRYEKELDSWTKDRDQLKKAEKQMEEFRSRISVLDKSVEDISSKLKAEEAKRREAENKAKLSQINASKTVENKSSTSPVEEKSAVSAVSPTAGKLSDFRSKFEKFGGSGGAATGAVSKPGSTPGPVRRSSGSSPSTGPTDSFSGDSALDDLQRQLAELEKSRAKDRQELLDKIASQKKDFDGELQDLKKRNSQLDARSQELSAVQKNVVDLRCKLDEERSVWTSEKSRLQVEIDEALKTRDEARIKAEGLAAQVATLKAGSSVVPGDDVKASKSKSSTSNSSTLSSATKSNSPSVVIPVRRIGAQFDDGNSTPEATTPGSGATSPAAASFGDDIKARRSLFTPVSSLKSTGSLASSKETRNIPITKLSRPPTPRI